MGNRGQLAGGGDIYSAFTSDTYTDCYDYNPRNEVATGNDHEVYVINTSNTEYDRFTLPMRIYFEPAESLDAVWRLTGGLARLRGDLTENLPPSRSDNRWLTDSDLTDALFTDPRPESVRPYMVVDVPLVYEYDAVDRVMVEAEATFAIINSDRQIENLVVTRQVQVIFLDTSLYSFGTSYGDYRATQRAVETFPTLPGMVLIAVGCAVGGVVLVRRGALVAPIGGRGGVVVVVRQKNGLQKLGIEAHALKTLSAETQARANEGVYVGVVNPQSPAGRAGLRSQDILTSFAGKSIRTPNELSRAAGRIKRGEVVEVVLMREGAPQQLFVKF